MLVLSVVPACIDVVTADVVTRGDGSDARDTSVKTFAIEPNEIEPANPIGDPGGGIWLRSNRFSGLSDGDADRTFWGIVLISGVDGSSASSSSCAGEPTLVSGSVFSTIVKRFSSDSDEVV